MLEQRWRMVAGVALVSAAALLAFLRCHDYGLVNFDDYLYVETASLGVGAWFTDMSRAIWMPITWASYGLDRALAGDSYGWWHLTSVSVHAVNSVLVFLLVRRLMGFENLRRVEGNAPYQAACAARPPYLIPVLAAVAWAVHPLRVESVVAISSRKDVLSLFFLLVALLAWTRRTARGDLCAAVALALGAMCKPSVMTFPLLCLVVDAFIVGEVVWRRYVVIAPLAVAIGIFAAIQQRAGAATIDYFHENFLARLVDSAAAFGIYVKNTLWPADLAPQCMKKFPQYPRGVVFGLVASAAWAFGCVAAVRRRVAERGRKPARPDWAAVGLLWFAVAIAPMLGLARFGFHAFADRFTYIPAIGLSIAAAGLCERWVEADARRRAAVGLLGFALAVALSAQTWRQTGYWEDDGRLFAHTVEVDGEPNAVAHASLGAYHFEFTHDLEKCVRELALAEEQDARFMLIASHVQVYALCELGRVDEAEAATRRYEENVERLVAFERGSPLERTFAAIGEQCRIACLAARKETLAEADRRFLAASAAGRIGGADRVYLGWRITTARGDAVKAEACRRSLEDNARRGRGYLRFRYLLNEKTVEGGKTA